MRKVLFNMFNKSNSYKIVVYGMCLVLMVTASAVYPQDSKNQQKKKTGEVIDQAQRELDKAAKLKVKTRTKYSTFYKKNGKLWDKKTLIEKVSFGQNGLRREHVIYGSRGGINSKYTYTYDAKGNLTASTTFDSQKNTTSKRTSVYDKNGNEIERRIDDGKNPGTSKMFFTYDKDGNLFETKIVSNTNQLKGTQTINYTNGLQTKVVSKDANGKVAEEISNTYDASGKLITEDKKYPNGIMTTSYKYDANGNVTEISNNQWKRYMSYNKNGDLTEDKLYLPDGARQFRVGFTYNTNGLQNEEIRYDTVDKPAFYTKYVYEYYKK